MKDMLKDRVVAAIGDEYDIGDELGRGGMSVVYSALDLRLMRQVAVKVLPPEFAYDSGIRERFRREARTAAQLSHPHIVPIFSVDEREGMAYFVMALCEGESLAARLARAHRPPLAEVQRILIEVCDALAYAHGKGVVHRDIKPDNVLIERDSGRSLVTDFGIARAAEGGLRLTVTGIAMGTPTYMSPEQAIGESELDGRSDVYSLGALAYQMVCGVPPFVASNTPSLLLKHVSEELQPIAARRPDVPPGLAAVIERALEKKAERRWQSAAAMREALQKGNLLTAAAARNESAFSGAPPSGAVAGNPGSPGTSGDFSAPGQHRAVHPAPRRSHNPRPDLTRRPVEARVAQEGSDRHSRGRTPDARDDARRDQPAGARRNDVDAAYRSLLQHDPRNYPAREDSYEPAGAEESRWFGEWRRDKLDSIFRAIHGVKRGMLASEILVALNLFIFFLAMASGADEFAVLFVMSLVPTLGSLAFLATRVRKLRKLGVRFRDAIRSKRELAYSLPHGAKMGSINIPASSEIMDGPLGRFVRQALRDQEAITAAIAKLAPVDRKLLPDVVPTVKALVERVCTLAPTLDSLERDLRQDDPERITTRIAEIEAEEDRSPSTERTLQLLIRQRDTLEDLGRRRENLRAQIESAALLLQNIKLDLMRVGSSGVGASFQDVNTATQEARALSQDIGYVLSVADDLRKL